MQNEIWEQFGQFLNRLRGENVTRNTAVKVPEYKETQDKLESMREKCEIMLQRLPQEEQQMLSEWTAKLEEMSALEWQKAYCQGYVDCILLLSGMGLLRQDLAPEELMKWFNE